MDKTQLEKLAKAVGAAHPVYQLALDYIRVAKTLSTYVYVPDAEGLIHTQYVNAPSTGRLASRNYNLQNVGKRETNPWAKKARRQIVAREGHVFVQADSTSIEAVVTGYLIGDPTFVEVAKQSIHAYLACKELGWDFTPETIERVKQEHKALYNQFKTAVYLLLYGGDPYLMHMTNPDLFPTKRSAQEIQAKIFALMPALPAWQTRVREQAKREGVLQSPWGYRHHFYDVYTFKRDAQGHIQLDEAGAPQIKLGQDAKRALAFIPQNCAGAFCRESLLLIGESRWGACMPANVSVHDGYLLEVPEAEADAAEAFLVDVLTRPVAELGGLRIPCETDRGYNWADWSPTNPRGMRTRQKVTV
jgi:DNA polymerase I-like protein with 3'-5' exonuclease and polymerase domains